MTIEYFFDNFKHRKNVSKYLKYKDFIIFILNLKQNLYLLIKIN